MISFSRVVGRREGIGRLWEEIRGGVEKGRVRKGINRVGRGIRSWRGRTKSGGVKEEGE